MSTQERRSYQLEELLPIEDAIRISVRAAVLRSLQKGEISCRYDDNDAFRNLVDIRVNELIGARDATQHILLRNVDPSCHFKSPLGGEAVFWDMPDNEVGKNSAEGMINSCADLQELPPEAHKLTIPLYMCGRRFGHSGRTGTIAEMIAQRGNKDGEWDVDPSLVSKIGLVHDLGKFHPYVAELSKKKGEFTTQDHEKIKIHSVYGALAIYMLMVFEEGKYFPSELKEHFEDICYAILRHHVWFDGNKEKSYPTWVDHDDLSKIDKIISVADAYDAAYTREYSDSKKDTAGSLGKISSDSGTQFDPGVIYILNKVRPELVLHKPHMPKNLTDLLN